MVFWFLKKDNYKKSNVSRLTLKKMEQELKELDPNSKIRTKKL